MHIMDWYSSRFNNKLPSKGGHYEIETGEEEKRTPLHYAKHRQEKLRR
jgi:hypothetical protein